MRKNISKYIYTLPSTFPDKEIYLEMSLMIPLRTVLVMLLLAAAVLLAAGCAGESVSDNKNSGDLSPLKPVRITAMPTLTLPTDQKSTSGSEIVSTWGSTKDVLIFLNRNTNWNLSPSQIDEYSVYLENGVLKKYRTNPDFPHALFIPDEWQFYHEIGESLGFTKEEADVFVAAIKEREIKTWQIGDCRNYSSPDPKEGCPQVTVTMDFSIKPRTVVTAP